MVNGSKPSQIQFLLYAGSDIMSCSDQITSAITVRCGQERQELVRVMKSRRLLEEPDREGGDLLAEVLAEARSSSHCWFTWKAGSLDIECSCFAAFVYSVL